MSDRLEARPVAERTIYEGRVIDLRIETVEAADGSRHEREIIDHRGAAAIVALDRDEVERVEWRHAVEMVERGEIADAKSIVGLLWLARLIERGEIIPIPGVS